MRDGSVTRSGQARGPLAGLLAVLTGAAVLAGLRHRQHLQRRWRGRQDDPIWEGYTAAEAKAFAHLVTEYEAQHPGQKVSPPVRQQRQHAAEGPDRGARRQPAGHRLPLRLLGAQRGADPAGGEPDQVVKRPGVNWNDFWTRRARRGHRQRQGDRHPGRWWTTWPWSTTRRCSPRPACSRRARTGPGSSSWPTRKKLTNPANKQFGTAYVTPGTEDTVWHWEALLWEAGGELLTPGQQEGGVRLGRRAGSR